MFHTELMEKIKTGTLYSINYPGQSCRLTDMWKNMVEQCRPQITIWRMRIVCWITKATGIHSEYGIPIAFLLQQWLHKRDSMLRHTYTVCLADKDRPKSTEHNTKD